jgi:hypothetical protein
MPTVRHAAEKHVGRFSGLLPRYVTIKPCTARSRKTWKSYTQFRPDHLHSLSPKIFKDPIVRNGLPSRLAKYLCITYRHSLVPINSSHRTDGRRQSFFVRAGPTRP